MHYKSYMLVGPLSPGADSKDYLVFRAKTDKKNFHFGGHKTNFKALL